MDLKIDGEQSLKVQAEIRRLLHIFEVYRPDISYVQGMSYLAWIFLIRMDIYTAFRCFCNVMMGDSFINGLYSFDEVKIRTIIAFFEECLQDKKPKLFKHMQQLGVESELFCIEWAYTFYSRAFSLRIVSYFDIYIEKYGICGSVKVTTYSSRWR